MEAAGRTPSNVRRQMMPCQWMEVSILEAVCASAQCDGIAFAPTKNRPGSEPLRCMAVRAAPVSSPGVSTDE